MVGERVYVVFHDHGKVGYVSGRDEEEARDLYFLLLGLRPYFFEVKYVRLTGVKRGEHYAGLEKKLRHIRAVLRGIKEVKK